jgi:dTDP-3,4-didehydro-2,6-dideoxy-alpha-D-glucose 3-reductase
MSKLRIGVMGCANIAKRFVLDALHAASGCELVAIASRDKEKCTTFANQFKCRPVHGYDQLLCMDDIDAVYMPLPTGLHEEWMLKAIKAGKHILAEKSLALNYDSALRIGTAARENAVVVMENYMFQFHSQQQQIRQIIASGELGDMRIFRSSFGFPPLSDDNFRYAAALGGGCLLDAGGYPLKACQLLFGNDIDVKAAFLKYDKSRGVDIFGSAMLLVNNDSSSFPAEISFGFDNFYQCNYEIWGSKGKLTAHRAFTAGPGFMPVITVEKQGDMHEYTLPADNHFKNSIEHFVNAVINKRVSAEVDAILKQANLQQEIKDCAN